MQRWLRRMAAWLLALTLALTLAPCRGGAVLEGVYLTAVNDQVLDMSADTMPFWSNGALYVSSAVFEGTDLGVSYVRNNTMGLAVLYTTRVDLRFDLVHQTTSDKHGNSYSVRAIERGGTVFFPLDMICGYFGLAWSLNDTETVPLLRITSSSVRLDDETFLVAAASMLNSRYQAYEKQVLQSGGHSDVPSLPPAAGRKVFLVAASRTPEDTLAALKTLREGQAITILLTTEQMENGDLLRALAAGGHGIALLAQGEGVEEVRAEVAQARELVWQAACCWMNLVWYEGGADVAALLEELGCSRITVELDWRKTPLDSLRRAGAMVGVISRYRIDLPVYLGHDGENLTGLLALLEELDRAEYRLCVWRPRG